MGITERRRREKEQRQRLIQDAALEVFLQKGFHSATIEDIANQAELSTATIYLYFKNKYELYASLNLLYLEFLRDRIEDVHSDDRLSIPEKMIGFKDAMYNTFKKYPVLLKIIFHVQLYDILPDLDPNLLNKLNRVGRSLMNMMGATYEEGAAQGLFKPGHGMTHADILWSLFSGLVVWEGAKRQIASDKDFLKSTLDRAFDIICWGIQADGQHRQ